MSGSAEFTQGLIDGVVALLGTGRDGPVRTLHGWPVVLEHEDGFTRDDVTVRVRSTPIGYAGATRLTREFLDTSGDPRAAGFATGLELGGPLVTAHLDLLLAGGSAS